MKQFNLIVCGGTFDHFHKGHEEFLKFAHSIGKKVIVGVTSDEYIRSSKSEIQSSKFIETFEKRKETVINFLKQEKGLDKTEIVEINDLFGSTLEKDLPIDAIVVSRDTEKGAKIINQQRKKLGLKLLQIFIAPSIKAEDEELISSNRIRNGEINREGRLYVKDLWFNKDLKLAENLREEFQKPFGELLLGNNALSNNDKDLIITVGDITTKLFNEKSLSQNLSVIDFKVKRKQRFFSIAELGFSKQENIIKVDNPAGFITKNLFKKLSEFFKSNMGEIILQINGEEDLAVLPLVLLAPLSTIVYYGQPGKGLVKVVVSEEAKNKAYNLVLKLK